MCYFMSVHSKVILDTNGKKKKKKQKEKKKKREEKEEYILQSYTNLPTGL